jgi:cell division protein FtsL
MDVVYCVALVVGEGAALCKINKQLINSFIMIIIIIIIYIINMDMISIDIRFDVIN